MSWKNVFFTHSHIISAFAGSCWTHSRVSGIGGGIFGFKSTYNNTAIGYVKTQVDSNTTQHSFRVSQTTKINVRFVFYSAWIRLWLPKSLFWTWGCNSFICCVLFNSFSRGGDGGVRATHPVQRDHRANETENQERWLLITPPVTTGCTARESLLYTEPPANIQGFKMWPLL